jgi:hypothetical protein
MRMSGKAWKWIHLGFVFFFTALWGVAFLTGWINSVAFISHVSMVALVYAAASAWQAARAEEVEEERDENLRKR